MARTFHRHRHGDENVQSKCQQFKKKKKMKIFKNKNKKMKCTKGKEIYTNIKSGICFQCKKIGYKEVLK